MVDLGFIKDPNNTANNSLPASPTQMRSNISQTVNQAKQDITQPQLKPTQPAVQPTPKATIPSPVQSPIAGLNKSTIGSDFSQPKGAEQTAFTNMPPTVQQNIVGDMVNASAPQSDKVDVNTPMNFTDKELSFLKQAKEGGYTMDQAMNFVLQQRGTPQEGGGLAQTVRNLKNFTNMGPQGEFAVNPLGSMANGLNDLVQKIPTLTQSERDKFAQDHLGGFGVGMGAVPTMIVNAIPSFLKTITGMASAILNPVDTAASLLSLVFTPEGHQALSDRYGSWENLGKTMTEDPVGLASDALMLVSGGAGIVGKGAELGELGAKAAGAGELAQGLGKVGETAGKVSSTAGEFATMGAYPLIDEGLSQLREFSKIAQSDTAGIKTIKTLGKYAQMTAQPLQTLVEGVKGVATKLPTAEGTLQRMNRLTKGEQEKFVNQQGVSVGQWLNDRGIVDTPVKTIEQLADYFTINKAKVDQGLEAIQGKFTNEDLSLMANDAARFAENTRDPKAERIRELQKKADGEGLSMPEVNEVKRYFEQKNKFTYGRDLTAGEKTQRATNVDSAVREWQMNLAEQNGFDNLKEMNKETQASKFIMDKLAKNENGRLGNNAVTLTDRIVAAPALIEPNMLGALLTKKILQSNWFAKNYVKVINKLNGHVNLAEKVADLSAISKIQSEKEMQNRLYNSYLEKGKLENPALPETTQTNIGTMENPIVAKQPNSIVDMLDQIKQGHDNFLQSNQTQNVAGDISNVGNPMNPEVLGGQIEPVKTEEKVPLKGEKPKVLKESKGLPSARINADEWIKKNTTKQDKTIFYHGTRQEFDKFIDGATREGGGYNSLGDGVYLTTDELYAKNYANIGEGKVKRVIETELNGKTIPLNSKIPNKIMKDIGNQMTENDLVDLGVKKFSDVDYLEDISDLRNTMKSIGKEKLFLDTLEENGIVGFQGVDSSKKTSEYIIPRAKNVKIIGNKYFSLLGPVIGGGVFLAMMQGNQK